MVAEGMKEDDILKAFPDLEPCSSLQRQYVSASFPS
jgi:hypothetical protein